MKRDVRRGLGAALATLGLAACVFQSGCSGCGGGSALELPDGSEGPRIDAPTKTPVVTKHDASKTEPVDAGHISDATDASDATFSFIHAIDPFDASVGPGSALRCADGGVSTAYLFDQTGALYTYSPTTFAATLIGTPNCGSDASNLIPWTLTVSREGVAYLVYQDWNIYAVNLETLACTQTEFHAGQLGIYEAFGVAVSRATTPERFYVFGQPLDGGELLASSDLTDFDLTEVGPSTAGLPPTIALFDTQADLFGHVFVYTADGILAELDENTGAVLGGTSTGFPDSEAVPWAIMTYDSDVYLFGGQQVARFDFTTQQAVILGSVTGLGMNGVFGASAVPCYGGP